MVLLLRALLPHKGLQNNHVQAVAALFKVVQEVMEPIFLHLVALLQ